MSKSMDANVWDASYDRGGNIVFYPHEEIVRFINKYVKKRTGINDFCPITEMISKKDEVASLDLGCGIGRHVNFLDEFGLNPYGIDLSERAINTGKEWMKSMGKDVLADHMVVASVSELPFKDDFFSVCVSHGVLDSMPREVAVQGMKEVRRVLKPGALMYLDLIMDPDLKEGDEVVDEGYEEGTIQSYFTVKTIQDFLKDFEIVDFRIIDWTDETRRVFNKRAHLIIKNSK